MNIYQNIENVKQRIAEVCLRSGRNPNEVTLIGVTKTMSADIINSAIEAGLEYIGENRVQELEEKYNDLKMPVHIHLIGHLQSNKVKYIADKVELIHSVDSISLADEISRQGKLRGKIIDTLIQVNVSGEESKFGIPPEQLDDLFEHIASLEGIRVKGLMTIPPVSNGDFDIARKVFHNLYKIFIDKKAISYNNINMEHLSMGMSDDFEVAIEEGATMVRVGRAIFGKR
jgi:pyridoxal phosphate enzyme (YggS family)